MICGGDHPFDTPDRLLVLDEQGQVTGDMVILALIPGDGPTRGLPGHHQDASRHPSFGRLVAAMSLACDFETTPSGGNRG